jgi:hypothetical protein
MNSPIKDLADYLVANASMTMGTNLFAGILPEADGTITALMDTGGTSPEPTDIENPTVQVLVRARKGRYQDAYAQMRIVLEVLHRLSNTTINDTVYIVIWKLTEILNVGEDKRGRPILSCNLRIQRTDLP